MGVLNLPRDNDEPGLNQREMSTSPINRNARGEWKNSQSILDRLL